MSTALPKDRLAQSASSGTDATDTSRQVRGRWAGTGAVQEPDLEGAASAASAMLDALGVDLTNESMARTPERMVSALAELLSPRPF